MSTMNVSVPEELKDFVDRHIQAEGYGTSSENMRDLIRRDRNRVRFRDYLMEGVKSKAAARWTRRISLRRRIAPTEVTRPHETCVPVRPGRSGHSGT